MLGHHVSHAEYEKKAKFNLDCYKPTPDEINRFPSRPKNKLPERDHGMDLTPTISSRKDNTLKLKPPSYRER